MMKILLKYLALQCLLFISMVANAHNPDLSSILLVEESEGQWVLQIRAALTAFEYEIDSHFGESSYATPEEFQELVIQHVRDNVSIQFNENHLAVLHNALVKLGHETSITFKLPETPNTIESLLITNSSFKDISRNQSALIVLKKGFGKQQFNLNNTNQHTAQLEVKNSAFHLLDIAGEQRDYSVLLFFTVALMSLLILFILFKIGQKNKLNPSLQNKLVSV